MDELDYFTVMESRIRYFAEKYDPKNKLGSSFSERKVNISEKTILKPKPPEEFKEFDEMDKPFFGNRYLLKSKILKGFDLIVSFLF